MTLRGRGGGGGGGGHVHTWKKILCEGPLSIRRLLDDS